MSIVRVYNKNEENIKELNNDIDKLNDMFLELQTLVSNQNTSLDSIVDHIDIIQTDVIISQNELKKAYELQKSTDKMKFTLYGILATIFGIRLL
jgi:t-SNARE complex subunit (syntaxin)